jgi:hypothetical protein
MASPKPMKKPYGTVPWDTAVVQISISFDIAPGFPCSKTAKFCTANRYIVKATRCGQLVGPVEKLDERLWCVDLQLERTFLFVY